jgi:mono/diheme cytochrome c family protein
MKKLSIISVFFLSVIVIISCGDDVQRTRGANYMPDMWRSRAYETYDDHSNLASKGIRYNSQPVGGTVARGDELPYHLRNDSAGYNGSASVVNPLKTLTPGDLIEAERLYNINCGICHGSKLDGNGPLYKGGEGPYAAKPATLVGDPVIEAKTEGTYFHVQTYGKGMMGSYASQLNRTQRWMIARFIKSKQAGASPNPPPTIPQGDTTKSVTTQAK